MHRYLTDIAKPAVKQKLVKHNRDTLYDKLGERVRMAVVRSAVGDVLYIVPNISDDWYSRKERFHYGDRRFPTGLPTGPRLSADSDSDSSVSDADSSVSDT